MEGACKLFFSRVGPSLGRKMISRFYRLPRETRKCCAVPLEAAHSAAAWPGVVDLEWLKPTNLSVLKLSKQLEP